MNFPHHTLHTERLQLDKLSMDDYTFILRLVNTDGWIRFIGDRHVHSEADAQNFIDRIMNDPARAYWTVRLKDDVRSIGLVTIIQRVYLPDPDIGFAFLPEFQTQGYALEAATAVAALADGQQLLATTLADNVRSIHLLRKLGFVFDREIAVDTDKLMVYKR